MGVFSPLLCSLILAVLAYVEAGMVNVCSDIKDCVKCTDSYVNIFAFREYCRYLVRFILDNDVKNLHQGSRVHVNSICVNLDGVIPLIPVVGPFPVLLVLLQLNVTRLSVLPRHRLLKVEDILTSWVAVSMHSLWLSNKRIPHLV